MQVLGLKLVSGEDLTAELIEDGVNYVKIKRALSLQIQMTQAGPQAGFVPWSLLIPENTEVTINKTHILTQFNVELAVEKQYIQSVTGIDLAGRPSQILHG